MPFLNQHAFRIKDPGKYEKFARKNIDAGIDIILGIIGDKSETQAYRFSSKSFTFDEAKKWMKDHNLTYIMAEKASGKTQSFLKSIYLESVKIQGFTQDDILQKLPQEILSEIKSKDSHPFFQMYSLCHEGVSVPKILGEKAQPITWPKKAIQSIKNVITKGIKLFVNHNKDNSTTNRKRIGEIVHSYEEEREGKLHYVIITYHKPDEREEAKKYDICSQEADWNFFEAAGKLFADTMEKLTGVAVGNSAQQKPAFSGAKRLGFVQAFQNNTINDINEGESKMSDILNTNDVSVGEADKVKKQLKFDEWLRMKDLYNVYPRQLFKLEDLRSDREFGKYFEELEALKEENKTLKEQIKEERDNYNSKINGLKRKIYIGSANERLNKMMDLNNYPEKMKAFLNKSYEINKDKLEDLTDEGLEEFMKKNTQVYQNFMSISEDIEPKTDKNNTNNNNNEEGNEDPNSLDGVIKKDANPFLEEDLDPELFSEE